MWKTLLLLALIGMGASVAADTAKPQAEHIHVLRPGETLWSVSRDLLEQPGRWQELKQYNRVRRDRGMPIGSTVRIPSSWLKRVDLHVEVLRVSGDVRGAQSPATATRNLTMGDRFRGGGRVITGAQSYATLRMPDGSIVQIAPESSVVVNAKQAIGTAASEIRFEIERGRVESQVVPRANPDAIFEIRTPAAQLGVRGTQFRVALTTDGKRSLAEVESGAVAAANYTLPGTASVEVSAGLGTVVHQGQPPLPPIALLAPADLRSLSEIELGPDIEHIFDRIDGAVAYRVQLALDAGFQRTLTERVVREPAFRFSRLPDGRYHVRVRAIDRHDLEGRETRISFTVRDLGV